VPLEELLVDRHVLDGEEAAPRFVLDDRVDEDGWVAVRQALELLRDVDGHDLTLLSVLTKLKARNTDALISAVAEVMRGQGIELLDSTAFLAPLLAREGVLTARAPTEAEQADFEFGYGWPTRSRGSTSASRSR
jgi:DUF1009 family protein